MTYTKGKWIIDNDRTDKLWSIMTEDHILHIGAVNYRYYNQGKRITPEEAKANAQLIASAPDLLEALESVLKLMKQEYKNCNEDTVGQIKIREIEQAINKAKGGN